VFGENSYLKTLRVQQYHDDHKLAWDTFCEVSNADTFLFQRDFMEYHKERFQDFSLLVLEDDTIVSILPAHLENNKVCSHRGLTYGGVVFKKHIGLKKSLLVFEAILKFLESQKISQLELTLLPKIYEKKGSDQLKYALFLTEAVLMSRDVISVIDLRLPVTLKSLRKRGVKKGEKEQLVIKQDNDFKSFWTEILEPLLQSQFQTKPVHTLEEILSLAEKFPKHIKQYNVYKEDKLVAGTTVFEMNDVAHTQYIAGNDDRQQLGSLDFLFYHLTTETYKDKNYLSLGTSNADAGKQLNVGLQTWKEGFGATAKAQETFLVETSKHHLITKALI